MKLKALSGREDCQHDYINASYIDVSKHAQSSLQNTTTKQLYLYAEYLIETGSTFLLFFLQGYGIARKFVATQGQLIIGESIPVNFNLRNSLCCIPLRCLGSTHHSTGV